MEPRSIVALVALVGKQAWITADGWEVLVDVHDVKQAYGVDRLFVSQNGGTRRWVDASRYRGTL